MVREMAMYKRLINFTKLGYWGSLTPFKPWVKDQILSVQWLSSLCTQYDHVSNGGQLSLKQSPHRLHGNRCTAALVGLPSTMQVFGQLTTREPGPVVQICQRHLNLRYSTKWTHIECGFYYSIRRNHSLGKGDAVVVFFFLFFVININLVFKIEMVFFLPTPELFITLY